MDICNGNDTDEENINEIDEYLEVFIQQKY